MKKVLIGLAAMAMMGMMMTSCQKEEGLSKNTFTATTENGGSKTYLDGLSLKWAGDEGIMVYGLDGAQQGVIAEAPYWVTSTSDDGTRATFACYEGEEVDAPYYQIYYPDWTTTQTNGNKMMILDNTQWYVENSMTDFPMYAETQSHAFQFTNLCGVFRLQLQKTGKVISNIRITTDQNVYYMLTINTNSEGKFQLEACEAESDNQKRVTLDCGNGVSIDELTDFNIFLPVGEYSIFTITITATDGTRCVKNLTNGPLTINRNERVTLTRTDGDLEFAVPPVPEDAIRGRFTIDANGNQVYFSKGNLQNINGQWLFATHQYDYLGSYSATAWDLFGWSTTANNFGMSTSTSSTNYEGDFIDWGTVIGDGHTWRTLQRSQWSWLIFNRASASVKRGYATVVGVHGLVLLPDDWTLPTGLTFNSGFGSWGANEYDVVAWEQMEAAGAIFLPAAGYRGGGGNGMYSAGSGGFYWTSSPYGRDAYYMQFTSSSANATAHARRYGCAVRLVQDY